MWGQARSGQEDRLHIDEFLDAKAAMLASVARILNPTERHVRIHSPEGVDADHAGIKVVACQLEGAVLVLGKDPAIQTIAACVR